MRRLKAIEDRNVRMQAEANRKRLKGLIEQQEGVVRRQEASVARAAVLQQKKMELVDRQELVDKVLQTRGKGTELLALKRREIQLDIQFEKSQLEAQRQIELEEAIGLMGHLEIEEQHMVNRLQATQKKENVAKI